MQAFYLLFETCARISDSMLLSHLKEWTAAEIDLLFEVKPREGRSIDYKERIPKNLDDILPDVSAFANTHGGTIIFGIFEEAGIPVECIGLDVQDPDKETLRLSSVIENNLDPALRGCRQDWITTNDGKTVLALRIPQSGIAPHRITKGSPKFYTRGEAGNSPMDTLGLRNAFETQGAAASRFRAFVDERCRDVGSETAPFRVQKKPTVIMHIMPLSAVSRPIDASVIEIKNAMNGLIPPMSSTTFPLKVFLDGVAMPVGLDDQFVSNIVIFRNGTIEIVLECGAMNGQEGIAPIFWSALDYKIPSYVAAAERIGSIGPWMASMAFLNCLGLRQLYRFNAIVPGKRSIDSSSFILPPLFNIEDGGSWSIALKYFADRMANYFGQEKSLFFKDSGEVDESFW